MKTNNNVIDKISNIFLYKERLLKRCDKLFIPMTSVPWYYIVKNKEVQFASAERKIKSHFLNVSELFFKHEIVQNAINKIENTGIS